ncbi:MAG: virulence RhuM family protein [Bacteroidetes bacterium]|nr:virulence RhuM family protein [Bacteroidota bacterium]
MYSGEIIVYQPGNGKNFQIDVRFEEDTVWLNRKQLSELFDRDIKTIGKHINNALKEELQRLPVVAKFATTAADGKIYQTEHYNLDMILSVGYRVNSNQGVQFRIWANEILKQYLLKGYAIHQRIEQIENKIEQHDKQFDLLIKTTLPPQEGIFFDGQIFDAYTFVAKLIKSSTKELILIDNYIDETTLSLLAKKEKTVKVTVYTQKISERLQVDVQKFKEQYGDLELRVFKKAHDRFLIIDAKEVYHIGASIKDVGKKWFAFSKMNVKVDLMINELRINAPIL